MDGPENIIISKVSQIEKDKYYICDINITHMWNLKIIQMNL